MIERKELTDGLVLLRPIEAGDYENYLDASRESLSELSEWMWSSPDMPLEEVRRSYLSGIDEWEKGSGYTFSILDAGNQGYLGECWLDPVDSRHRMANLGYWVRTSQTKWWEAIRQALYEEIGDPVKDRDMLTAISPFFHPENIKRPLMVLQGANDPRVIKAESDDIVAAVRKNGVPVEYVVFEDEGHGFTKKKNNIVGWEAILRSLNKHLKGV